MKKIWIALACICIFHTSLGQIKAFAKFDKFYTNVDESSALGFCLWFGLYKDHDSLSNDISIPRNYLSQGYYEGYKGNIDYTLESGTNTIYFNSMLKRIPSGYHNYTYSHIIMLHTLLPSKIYQFSFNQPQRGISDIDFHFTSEGYQGPNMLRIVDENGMEISKGLCEDQEAYLDFPNFWPGVKPTINTWQYSFDSTFSSYQTLDTYNEPEGYYFQIPEIGNYESRNMYIRGYINHTDYITLAGGYIKIFKPLDNLISSVSISHVNCHKKGEVLVELDRDLYTQIELLVVRTDTLWSLKEPGQNSMLFVDLSAEDYILSIKKLDHPCPYVQPITILDKTLTGMDIIGKNSPICNGSTDGSFTVKPQGGVAHYRLKVTHNGDSVTYDFNTTKTLSGLKAGTYYLKLSDANQCIATETVIIEESPPFTLQTQKTDVTCFGNNNGRILFPSSPPGYSYYLQMVNGSSNHYDTKNYSPGKYLPAAVITKNGLYCYYVQADSLTITEPPLFKLNSKQYTNTSCYSSNDGKMVLNVAGGIKPYRYSIAVQPYNQTIRIVNGIHGNTLTQNDLPHGDFSISVSDNNNCPLAIPNFIIQRPPAPLSIGTTTVNSSCHGSNDGQISLLPSGGWGAYQTTWSDGYTGLTKNNLAPGNYSAQVKDAGGCIVNKPGLSITEPMPLTLTHAMHPASCFGMSDGIIKLTLSGGTKPYTVVFAGEQTVTNQDTVWITGLPAGNYSVGLTDAKLCPMLPDTIELTQPQPLVISSTVHSITCNGMNNGRIDITCSGGNGGYSYAWNDGPNTRDRLNLSSGIYMLEVSDAKACTVEGSYTIVEPLPLTIEADIDIKANGKHLTCHGGTDARVSLHSTGGNENHVYRVISPEYQVLDSGIISQLGAGTLEVEVVDQKGCTSQVEFTITGPEQPIQVNRTIEHVTGCYGDSTGMISLNATGGNEGFSYQPAGDDSLFPGTYNNLPGGMYSFEVMDTFGCIESLTLEIIQPDQIVFSSPVITQPRCFGSSDGRIITQASGGTAPITYTLADQGGFVSNGDFNNLSAGSYLVLAVDAKLCEVELPVIQLIDPLPLALNPGWLDVACKSAHTGWMSLTATGGTGNLFVGYKLKPGDAFYSAYTDTVRNLVTGRYPVIARDENLCQLVDTIEIREPEERLSFDAYLPVSRSDYHGYQVTQCLEDDGWAELHASGGNNPLLYSLTKDENTITQPEAYFGSLRAGAYQAKVLDAWGCSIDTLVFMLSPSSITLDSITRVLPDCQTANGEIQVFLSGGAGNLHSNWYKDVGLVQQNSTVASGLRSGVYTLETRDINSCTRIDTLVLSDKSGIPFEIGIDREISCYDVKDGQVLVTLQEPTPECTIQWIRFPEVDGPILHDIPAGRYYVMITDDQACTSFGEVELLNPSALGLSHALTPGRCHADSAAVVELFPSGGRPPYLYLRPGYEPVEHPVFDHLSTGIKRFVLTDQSGCLDSIEVYVPDQEKILNSVEIESPRCFGEPSGQIDLATQGGVPPYRYTLDEGEGQWSSVPSFGMLTAGTYHIRIKDAHDCPDSIAVQVVEPTAIEIHTGPIDPSECLSPTGSASVLTSGGTGPHAISWDHDPDHTGPSAQNLASGMYKILCIDSLGCTAEISLLVPTLEGPVMDTLWTESASCHDKPDGTIHLRLEGGALPLAVKIGTTEYTQFPIVDLLPGEYFLEVLDDKGCTTPASVQVSSPSRVLLDKLTVSAPACHNQTNGSINAQPAGGTPPYTLSVNQQPVASQSFALHHLGAGDYTLEISDARECQTMETVTLENPAPLILSVPDTVKICPGQQKLLYHGLREVSTTWNTPSGDKLVGDSILLTQVGDYMLNVVSTKLCEASASIYLEITSNLLETNFLMCSEVEVFDTLILLDITWPIPAYVSWEIPGSLPVLGGNHETKIIEAREVGTYTIYMEAMLEGCQDKIGKQLVVHPKPKSGQEIDLSYTNLPETLLEVSLYPNPTSESAKLVIRKEQDAAVSIEMYNIHGAKQQSIHLPGPGDEVVYDLNVKNLPAGMYLVRVQSGHQIALVHLIKVSN